MLQEADIVVTNPPFSLFKEYIAQLIEHERRFLILGNQNAIGYTEVFPLIKNGRLWLGVNNGGDKWFRVPSHYTNTAPGHSKEEEGIKYHKLRSICWFTNLDHHRRHEELYLSRDYSPEEYPHYDNYDAINIDKVKDIPRDYDGAMGVPITFLDKHNPDQFEILDANNIRNSQSIPFKKHGLIKDKDGTVNGVTKYVRIVIRHKGI